jgi:uncharacterized protein (TIGR02145 family)
MKTISTLILVIILASNIAIAQDTMYVHQKTGVITKIAVSKIDSVIFYPATSPTYTTVTDYDGNVYKTVTLGTQVWMAENLKTTRYSYGASIPLVIGNVNWQVLTANSKAYCWYNDDSGTNANTYGALYTWAAVMNGAFSSSASPSGIQGVCPTGWHVPSDSEWTILTDYLGGEDIAGGKLKETGTIHWNSPNAGATNETGFKALPGGNRNDYGVFNDISYTGFWWSATETGAANVWFRGLGYDGSSVGRNGLGNKEYGFSVRCLRD